MALLELSKRQQATVGAAITLFCGLFLVLALIGCFVLLAQALQFFAGVLLPLVTAAVLATMLKPYYEWLCLRVRRPALAVILVLASLLGPLIALLWFFGALLIDQLGGFLDHLPIWLERIRASLQAHAPRLNELWQEYGVQERLSRAVQQQGGGLARGLASVGGSVLSAGASVFRAVTGLFGWVVMPVYFVFLLQARPAARTDLEALLPFLKPETRQDVVYLAREFVNIMIAFFRGQMLIALAQGLLYGIGFKLVGLQYGLIIGLLMGFLNVIPYLGVLIGLALALPTALFQTDGGTTQMMLVGIVFVIVQCIEGYVLTPRIMGDRTGLHPMAIIFAMFFWGTALGGILGMILAIPLTAFLVVFWRLLKTKYIKELV